MDRIRLVETETVFAKVDTAPPAADAVTVAVSLFNYARYLGDCLDSVRAQTHAPLDLIIVDDCSDRDASLQTAIDWSAGNASRFGSACVLRHVRNQGLAQSRNTAFDHARTSLVFVLDADNQLYPRALSRLGEAMSDGSQAAAYSQIERFGSERTVGSADIWSRQYFQEGNYLDAMAMVRRDAWEKVGGYYEIMGGWEDYDFWCLLVEHGMTAAFVPEILCRYRVHGESMLQVDSASNRELIANQMTLRHPWLEI